MRQVLRKSFISFCGVILPRTAPEQPTIGKVLNFIEESDPIDLVFFYCAEGNIIHVGIVLENNYIIHVLVQVRIDRFDQTGIFDVIKNTHTHQLRLIKSIA